MMNWSNTNSSILSKEQWIYSNHPLFVLAMHVVNYVLGLPLNSYVMALLLNRRRSLDPCDVFTVNQAAAEISFMLLASFHILLNVKSDTWYYQPMGFFLGFGMTLRALLQCWVCLERYVAVVHPITFLKFRPLRYRVGMSVVAWIGGIGVGISCMMIYPNMPYQIFGVIYFIILSVNTFSCVSILNKLRHPGPGERNANRGMEDLTKKRAFQVVLINLLTFLAQNTPLAILFMFLSSLSDSEFKMAADICLTINLAVGYAQPVFVLHKAGKLFRRI